MSLRDLLKDRIVDQIINESKKQMKKKYTLIVGDEHTIKILDHCFKMHELNDLNVGVVLNVKYPRERVKLPPIYFLSNDYESTKAMVKDYENLNQLQYHGPVQIFYCQKPGTKILELIKSSNIRRFIKTLMEVNCDFFVLEKYVFNFGRGINAFKDLYIDKQSKSDELARTAEQLVGLCLTLNEDPYIRYSQSRNSKNLAELFKNSFNNAKHAYKKYNPKDKRGTLIILDRSDDPLTPLMHSLSFQAMVMDLLSDKIDKSGKTINLNNNNDDDDDDMDEVKGNDSNNNKGRQMPDENDHIWVQYRHTFIGDVASKLPQEFKVWQKENAVVKLKQMKNNNGSVDSKALLKAAKGMPQYKQLVRAYTTNISLASQVSNIFKVSGLQKIIELEQDIATGIDDNGKKCDRTKIQQTFCNDVLLNDQINEELKLRIFMMYAIAQGGMKPQQRKQLLKQSGFNEDSEDAILNLGNLGVTLTDNKPKSGHKNKDYQKEIERIAKSKVETTDMIRYTSYLEYILKSHNNNSLNSDYFAWIEQPKLKVLKTQVVHSWRRKKQNNNDNNSSQKINNNDDSKGASIIIYILGGVSYYELKNCYAFAKEKNIHVYIGSTQIMNPQRYIKNLKETSQNDY